MEAEKYKERAPFIIPCVTSGLRAPDYQYTLLHVHSLGSIALLCIGKEHWYCMFYRISSDNNGEGGYLFFKGKKMMNDYSEGGLKMIDIAWRLLHSA